jgi:hypothetical protein
MPFMRNILDWSRESACRGKSPTNRGEPDNYFPERGVNPTNARSICPQCPVVDECLSYGIIYDEDGIWGGLTRKERKRLKYLRQQLIQQAKDLGLYEHRPSVEELLSRGQFRQAQQVPLAELLWEEPAPTFQI